MFIRQRQFHRRICTSGRTLVLFSLLQLPPNLYLLNSNKIVTCSSLWQIHFKNTNKTKKSSLHFATIYMGAIRYPPLGWELQRPKKVLDAAPLLFWPSEYKQSDTDHRQFHAVLERERPIIIRKMYSSVSCHVRLLNISHHFPPGAKTLTYIGLHPTTKAKQRDKLAQQRKTQTKPPKPQITRRKPTTTEGKRKIPFPGAKKTSNHRPISQPPSPSPCKPYYLPPKKKQTSLLTLTTPLTSLMHSIMCLVISSVERTS